MKAEVTKIFSLTENYKNSFDKVSKKLPEFDDPSKEPPAYYFLAAEIIEQIMKMDHQLFEKFEYIIDLCMEKVRHIKTPITDKKLLKNYADSIEEFKHCKVISQQLREKALINLNQIKLPEFSSRIPNFKEDEKKEIEFSKETLHNYHKKDKDLFKEYDRCLAKATKLYRIIAGDF